MTGAAASILNQLTGSAERDIALICRQGENSERSASRNVELFAGQAQQFETLEQLASLPGFGSTGQSLVLVPYGQVREKGYQVDARESAPLWGLEVGESASLPREDFIGMVQDGDFAFQESGFDVDDEEYAAKVRDVIDTEIGSGQGANFVLHRSVLGSIEGFGPAAALTLFRRLLAAEGGAQWIFLIRCAGQYWIGASPERHVTLDPAGIVGMNPISGTLRYPQGSPELSTVLEFLSNVKESEELYMVVDEELKMMSRICQQGPWVHGPYLREMSKLAHTEYFIKGQSDLPAWQVLRESLLAPTVTGSPGENACRVIRRHESTPRGYYSGVLALVQRNDGERAQIDSAILIRTAQIAADGAVRIGVGATVVRHSDPDGEVQETRSKAAAMLAALREPMTVKIGLHPQVAELLRNRNDGVARFWIEPKPGPTAIPNRGPVLVVDHEDDFTFMLAAQLRSLGLEVVVEPGLERFAAIAPALVVLGPGPGDPRDLSDPRMQKLRDEVRFMRAAGVPFIAICLSHQALSLELGLELRALPQPNQGVQRSLDLFGQQSTVAFYNTFCVHTVLELPDGVAVHPDPAAVQVAVETANGQVHALRAANFESFQFHPESVRSVDGFPLLQAAVVRLTGLQIPIPQIEAAEPRHEEPVLVPALTGKAF